MSIAAADVHKAVAALWESGGLNTAFQAFWSVADRSSFLSLNDGKAAPGTPYPYAVFSAPKPVLKERSSGEGAGGKMQVMDHPWSFEVYASQTSTKSAKQMASDMVVSILAVFGGHPLTSPSDMPLDNGTMLIAQYQDDWGERISDEIYKWTVNYNLRVDSPLMV